MRHIRASEVPTNLVAPDGPARLELIMNTESGSILQAIRAMGSYWEAYVTTRVTNGKKDEFTTDDVKYAALVAFMMVTELKGQLDAYEAKSAEEWMTIEQAAAEAACSRRTLFRAIKSGEIISKKVNGHRVVQRRSLDSFAQYRSLFAKE